MGNEFYLSIELVRESSRKATAVYQRMLEQTTTFISEIETFLEQEWEGKSKEAFVTSFDAWKQTRRKLLGKLGTYAKLLSFAEANFDGEGINAGMDSEAELHGINQVALSFNGKLGKAGGFEKDTDVVFLDRGSLASQLENVRNMQERYENIQNIAGNLGSYSFIKIDNPAEMDGIAAKIAKTSIENIEKLRNYKQATDEYDRYIDYFEGQVAAHLPVITAPDSYEAFTKMFLDGSIDIKALAELSAEDLDFDESMLPPELRDAISTPEKLVKFLQKFADENGFDLASIHPNLLGAIGAMSATGMKGLLGFILFALAGALASGILIPVAATIVVATIFYIYAENGYSPQNLIIFLMTMGVGVASWFVGWVKSMSDKRAKANEKSISIDKTKTDDDNKYPIKLPEFPRTPEEAVAMGWKLIPDPRPQGQINGGIWQFNVPVGEHILFVQYHEATIGATGHEGRNHWHVGNPFYPPDRMNLDINGYQVSRGKDGAHLYPYGDET